jgi:hypothetical protein
MNDQGRIIVAVLMSLAITWLVVVIGIKFARGTARAVLQRQSPDTEAQ